MAEVVSELDKLREAAKLIEEMSQGRLQVCPSVVGQVYIRPENEAYLGLDMRINSIPGQLRYPFQAGVQLATICCVYFVAWQSCNTALWKKRCRSPSNG